MPKYLLLILLLGVLYTSCVKDTDFNQLDDVVLTPVVELNFVYFTLQIDDFQVDPMFEGSLTVVDTTEVRFLNEDFAVDHILEAEFFFRVTNSFPAGLNADFTFLSEENAPLYEINFPIQMSEDGSPVITEFTQTVTQADIELLTQNNKVIITINLQSNDQNLEGALNLQSKTIYYLEFSDF
jgi:hypothetical protein